MRTFRLAEGVVLGQGDIRELQSAVAAVSSAVRLILDHAGTEAAGLSRVFLAGSFGAALNPMSAMALGLIPSVPEGVVQGVGNTALEGARAALLSFRERDAAFQIPFRAEYIELSGHPEFNEIFLDAMILPDPLQP